VLFSHAYILAGGASSRFGSDKALAIVEGVPNMLRLAQRLKAFGLEPVLVSRTSTDYADLGLRTIVDYEPGAGPLAGVLAALRDARDAWCLIVTCDMVDLDTQWVHSIENVCQRTAAKIVTLGPGFAPFPGAYRRDILTRCELFWKEGCRSMRSLFERLPEELERLELKQCDAPMSFNTAEELAELRIHFD
jgi:molybdopterin-guanine dinucleotide biosynthesis protein A